jgi:HSP20 family protein
MSHIDKDFGFDFGGSLDDIIHAARAFGEKMKDMAPDMAPWVEGCGARFDHGPAHGPAHGHRTGHPNIYFYPPTNSYATREGGLVFEFALAGIDEGAVSVTFQGDYLILSAKAMPRADGADPCEYFRQGFRPRDIDRQKYYVPAEDYAQDQAKAVFRHGVLELSIPPKEPEGEAIRIEIVKEGN